MIKVIIIHNKFVMIKLKRYPKRCLCCMFSCISTVLLILIFIIALTLALPVYKARNSRIRIQCAALQGIASSFDVQLSFTLKSARFL